MANEHTFPGAFMILLLLLLLLLLPFPVNLRSREKVYPREKFVFLTYETEFVLCLAVLENSFFRPWAERAHTRHLK